MAFQFCVESREVGFIAADFRVQDAVYGNRTEMGPASIVVDVLYASSLRWFQPTGAHVFSCM